jgi:TRAP-type uncharacterized transport system fused permease subunit
VFVLDPQGVGLLLMGSLKALADANLIDIGWITLTTALGIVAMSGAFQGWLLVAVNSLERLLLLIAGIALVFRFDYGLMIGFGSLALVFVWQWLRLRQRT